MESLEWCRAGKYKRREERVVVLEDGKWWYGVLAGSSVTHCLSGLSPSNCTAYVCARLQPFCLLVCLLSQKFKIRVRLFPQKPYQIGFEMFNSLFFFSAKFQWKLCWKFSVHFIFSFAFSPPCYLGQFVCSCSSKFNAMLFQCSCKKIFLKQNRYKSKGLYSAQYIYCENIG